MSQPIKKKVTLGVQIRLSDINNALWSMQNTLFESYNRNKRTTLDKYLATLKHHIEPTQPKKICSAVFKC